MNKNYGLLAVLAVIVAAAWYLLIYQPTHIALVNFQDGQMAEIIKANDNRMIRPEQISLKDDDFSGIVDFPVILLAHLSTLTETQRENLQIAMNNGAKVHVLMATSKENDLSNLSGEDLDYMKACFSNEGLDNIRRWLNYSRKVLDGKSLFTAEITPPKEYPSDVFYRIGTEDYFESVEDYWVYYQKADLQKPEKPTVAIVNVGASPQTLFREYQDSIILNLEARGYNVAAIAGSRKRLENLQSLNPDMVIYFPHGRLSMSQGDEVVNWLKEQNILLLTPQLVQQTYADWMADQQGMSGGIFGQNVVVPELDGAILPFAVAAQYRNEQGYHTFKPIPGRIDKFCEMASRWLALRDKPNADKKLTIYYYKGPGKNALVAGALEVGESIFTLLKKLKQEGYNLGNLPDNTEAFMERIHREGPILGEYAEGTFEEFLKNGNPILIPAQEYEAWCKSELDPASYQEVVDRYGPAPGSYYNTMINDTAYLAIPRVQFGNISLMPVLSAALGTNDFKMVHGVKQAPPHAYIASYLWPRMKGESDVVAHFGAHGSLEFTPWKQVLLSLQDWPEALTAPMPHLYIYSIDNIGEAMMAKRRTYATMVSHLTPPMAPAGLYGGLEEIAQMLNNYATVPDGELKEVLRDKVRSFTDTLDLQKDLGLTEAQLQTMNDETVDQVREYVHHLAQEKITLGLHTFGVSYSEAELNETARMMSVNPIAQSLEQLVMLRGTLPAFYLQWQDTKMKGQKTDFPQLAYQMVTDALANKRTAASLLAPADQKRLDTLLAIYGYPQGSVISEYYGGSYARKKTSEPTTAAKEDLVYDKTTHKMVPRSQISQPATLEDFKGKAKHLAASRKTSEGIALLKDPKAFKEISSLLDAATLHKFTNAAELDPQLTMRVDLLNNPTYKLLLTWTQDSLNRQALLTWLDLPETQEGISAYRKTMDEHIIKKAQLKTRDFLDLYKTSDQQFRSTLEAQALPEIQLLQENVMYLLDNRATLLATETNHADLTAISAILKSEEAMKKMATKLSMVDDRIRTLINAEKQELALLLQLRESLADIQVHYDNLKTAPVSELDAFVNGMNGGFVAPSSGGDPVSNPLSAPTGKNLTSINAEVTPTAESFELGKKMAEQILQKHIAKHGDYPKKIAYSLWGGEFIRNQGLNVGQILYMLGVEPVRNERGRVHDVRLIPMSELKRPRIDVVVQTSGQFRDIAASRIYLINKAIALASAAADDDQYANYVKAGTTLAEQQMKEKGMSPADARKFSTVRVFGGVNGEYGTNIMGLVEQGDRWETEEDIARQYIQNMGAMYAEDSWSQYQEGMFETMLQNTEVVVHPRSSNVTGPISLDHVYEFMGGITASIRVTTGRDPDGYFNDFRNKYNPTVQGLKEAIWTETRTNLFNPKFIKAQMEEGETAAENFAESFRDTYGWNVMKPEAIDKEIWEGYYDIYVKDSMQLGTTEFFKETNPYALQEMTAVMLETIRKGYWQPAAAVTKDIVNLHAELVRDHQAGCSGFVCDNAKLKAMIEEKLTGELKAQYQQAINTVRTGNTTGEKSEGVVLKKEETIPESLKELIQDNLSTILILIALLGGAIGWGVIKRKQS